MALAYLRLDEINGDQAVFTADIGTNKYYRYVIGSGQNKKKGLNQVSAQSHVSEILRNDEKNVFNSQFKLPVPLEHFWGESRFIQLYSYRDKIGNGPALSDIEEVIPQFNFKETEDNSLYLKYGMGMSQTLGTKFNDCRNTGFSFSEPEVSTDTLINTIIEVAKVLSPVAVASAGEIFKKGSPESITMIDDKAVVQIINSILDTLKTENAALKNGSSKNEADSGADRIIKDSGTRAKSLAYSKSGSVKLSRQFDGGIISGPALIGLITTLAPAAMKLLEGIIGPLAQQAPKILEVVYDNPVKLLNAVNEAKLQSKHEDNTHVQNLLAESNKGRLGELLIKSNVSSSAETNLSAQKKYESLFITSDKIRISVQNSNPLVLNGKSRYVYSNKENIRLQYDIISEEKSFSKPIPHSGFHLTVKDSLSMKTLLEKKIQLKDVLLNSTQDAVITKEESAGFPVNSDLIINIDYKWQSKGNKKFCTRQESHSIFIAGNMILNSIGEAISDEVPLTDINKYRVFWNKIWEGGTKSKRRWEVNFNTKYYTYYNHSIDSNGRIETKMKVKDSEVNNENSSKSHLDASVKSGYEYSAIELNKLLPEISGYNLLKSEELEALKSDDISKAYNQEAVVNLKLKGKDEESGAIWVYPEMTIHKFLLYKVQEVNECGQVTGVITEEISFPKPSSMHFLGVKTESAENSVDEEESVSNDPDTEDTDSRGEKIIKIEGYRILFDKKVRLMPVELVPIINN